MFGSVLNKSYPYSVTAKARIFPFAPSCFRPFAPSCFRPFAPSCFRAFVPSCYFIDNYNQAKRESIPIEVSRLFIAGLRIFRIRRFIETVENLSQLLQLSRFFFRRINIIRLLYRKGNLSGIDTRNLI